MSQTTETMTIFCTDRQQETTYISEIQVPYGSSNEQIAKLAVADCAIEWGMTEEYNDVMCIGIIEGSVCVRAWTDAYNGGLPTD